MHHQASQAWDTRRAGAGGAGASRETFAQLLQVLAQNQGHDLQQTLCALQSLPIMVQKAAGQQVEARMEDIAAQ